MGMSSEFYEPHVSDKTNGGNVADNIKEFWVPEDFIYECAADCLLAHPEQAAQLMRGDGDLIKYREAYEILLGACREEYEDYYRWIDDPYSIQVTEEYTDCIKELSRAMQKAREILK
jgi:hypothetical protein